MMFWRSVVEDIAGGNTQPTEYQHMLRESMITYTKQ